MDDGREARLFGEILSLNSLVNVDLSPAVTLWILKKVELGSAIHATKFLFRNDRESGSNASIKWKYFLGLGMWNRSAVQERGAFAERTNRFTSFKISQYPHEYGEHHG
jgi:hypothetical protein